MKQPIWKQELLTARDKYMRQEYPAATKDHGVPAVRAYKDTTSNDLTRCIVDYIKYHGGDAQRINTTGMMRKINGSMKWTRSGSRKGAADIHAIIKGRAVSIEIKIGKDKMSDDQVKEQQRIEGAGGLYFVAKDMDSFMVWYKENFL
jgi:hypothetical protein